MNALRLPFAITAACALLGSLPLRTQDPGPAAPPAASPMFTERSKRKAAFRNDAVLNAVRLGNGWLVGHQDENGGWDCDGFMKHDPEGKKCDGPGNAMNDVGVTALALLALLAQADPAHLEATRKAADRLARVQDQAGRFPTDHQGFIYDQAMATLAFTEAAALLGDPRYRTAATKGLQYLESHRNPGAAWRYQPHDGDNDTSITSWCIAAYGAATHAGIPVRAESVAEALLWLENVTDAANGATGYTKRGEGSARAIAAGNRFPSALSEAMTAAGMHVRAVAGLPRAAIDEAAATLLLKRPPLWDGGAIDLYYWFHGSEAMAASPDKAAAQKWYAALQKALLPAQRKDGACQGSWDPVDAWSEEGGRIYTTALAVLALSSAWRLGAIDAMAQVPDVPPFRRVYSMWNTGRFGLGVAALADARAAAPTADQLEQIRRIEWLATVQTTLGERLMAGLKNVYPGVCERHDRLEQLAKALAGTAPGKAAAEALRVLLAEPASRDEIESTRMLRAIVNSYDRYNPPKEPAKRKALYERLDKLQAKYPKTEAGKQAFVLMQSLR